VQTIPYLTSGAWVNGSMTEMWELYDYTVQGIQSSPEVVDCLQNIGTCSAFSPIFPPQGYLRSLASYPLFKLVPTEFSPLRLFFGYSNIKFSARLCYILIADELLICCYEMSVAPQGPLGTMMSEGKVYIIDDASVVLSRAHLQHQLT
jgi:hypothetical protein